MNFVIVYIVFVCLVVGVLFIVMPRIASETTIFVNQFPASLDILT